LDEIVGLSASYNISFWSFLLGPESTIAGRSARRGQKWSRCLSVCLFRFLERMRPLVVVDGPVSAAILFGTVGASGHQLSCNNTVGKRIRGENLKKWSPRLQFRLLPFGAALKKSGSATLSHRFHVLSGCLLPLLTLLTPPP
jgi:hypothetical protein